MPAQGIEENPERLFWRHQHDRVAAYAVTCILVATLGVWSCPKMRPFVKSLDHADQPARLDRGSTVVRSKDFTASSKSVMLIAFVLTIAALYFGRQVLIPLALGLVFSFLLTPFVTQLEKLHLGRVPAGLTVMALTLALIGTVSWGVAGQLVEVMAHVTDYKSNLDTKIQSLHAQKDGKLGKATATVKELNKELGAVSGQISANQSQNKDPGSGRAIRPIPVEVAAPPSNVIQDLRALLGPLAGVLESTVIVIIFTLFMLLNREDLRNRAIRLAGRGQLSLMTQALDDAGHRLSRYLLLQFVVNAGYGLLFGGGLYFIGVPHAFLWGVLAALLRFVPYIGTLAAATFPILMSLAVFPGWQQAGLAFGLFVVLEVLVSNFVEPTLYGVHTGISSLAILVAAIFWTTLWGSVGLILSTPLTVCLVVLGRYVPQLRFLEVVLGDEPVLTAGQSFYQRLLAMDQDEAREIAVAHLKDNSLESLYESILIPALRLAEQEDHISGLDDDSKRFVLRSTKELIEELGDQIGEGLLSNGAKDKPNGRRRRSQASEVNKSIVCIPSRNGADDLVALMLTQLLQHAGYDARQMQAEAVEELLASVSSREYSVVCVSSLLPFALAQTRALCRKLHASNPDVQIIVGSWDFEGGAEKARERLGAAGCPIVTTTLSDALGQIRKIDDPAVAIGTFAQQEKPSNSGTQAGETRA
jgi:predicted PurR-regulated permease PerM